MSLDGAEDKKQTESVTFRLSRDLLRELRRESEQNQTSLNTLASQVFRQYVGWHFSAGKAGWIPMHKGLLAMMIDKLTKEEIEKAALVSRDDIKDLIMLLRREYDFSSFLDVIEAWLTVCQFPYNHTVEINGKHAFVIAHNLGEKWSLYLHRMFYYIMEELASRPEFEVNRNSLTFKVDPVGCGILAR